jgi:hypothetical protein
MGPKGAKAAAGKASAIRSRRVAATVGDAADDAAVLASAAAAFDAEDGGDGDDDDDDRADGLSSGAAPAHIPLAVRVACRLGLVPWPLHSPPGPMRACVFVYTSSPSLRGCRRCRRRGR